MYLQCDFKAHDLKQHGLVVVLVVVEAPRAAVVSEFGASAEICHTSCCGASQ